MDLKEVPHPLWMNDAHNGVIPHKYVSIKRTQACVCCNRVHEWCELYAYTELKSTLGYKRVENLRRLDWPKYRLPIEQWEDIKCQVLPFCHDCHEPSLMNSRDMLDPPVEFRVVAAAQDPAAAVAAAKASGKVEVRKVKPTPAPRSVDWLMSLADE